MNEIEKMKIKRLHYRLARIATPNTAMCDKCGTEDRWDAMAHIGYNISRCAKCMGVV